MAEKRIRSLSRKMTENQTVEWKASWRGEYLQWVCGFANAQGGMIEAWGRGIEKVMQACNEHGLPQPILRYEKLGLRVEFEYLSKIETSGKTTRAIELQLSKLKNEGSIRRIGPAKGGHWVVGQNEEV